MIKKEYFQLSRITQKSRRELFLSKKHFRQMLNPKTEKDILFIVGSQRSGTTMMTHIFENDSDSKVYDEFSRLSSMDKKKLRLNPLEQVAEVLNKHPSGFMVLKPLVESQNILSLLDYFEGSKAIWMYRNYKDVAASNLKKFGENTGRNSLRAIVKNRPDNWRSENVPESIKAFCREHYSEELSQYDAMVLFWIARNSLFFELGLDQHPDVMLVKYADLVENPTDQMAKIYTHMGRAYPGPVIHKNIHADSLRKGKAIELSKPVEDLADAFIARLDSVRR